MFGIYGVLDWIFWGLSAVAFGMSVFALIHMIRTPTSAFPAAGKQTKVLWGVILGLATLFTFAAVTGYMGGLNIFVIASVIASGIYLADVRPAVKGMGRGGNNGPYGPW